MHQIITVDNDKFGKLRTIRQGDKMLFCATDVAKALGYIDPHKAIKLHCKSDGWANYPVIDNMGREQKAKFITEGDVWRLICHRKRLPMRVVHSGQLFLKIPLDKCIHICYYIIVDTEKR